MKSIKSWGSIIIIFMIVLWIGFAIVPFFEPTVSNITVRLLSVSFSIITYQNSKKVYKNSKPTSRNNKRGLISNKKH